jgi:hypothetical protein
MGLLYRINVAVFAVPLLLSSLVLRAMHAAHRWRQRRVSHVVAARRRAAHASARSVAASRDEEPVVVAPKVPHEAVRAMHRELAAVLDGHDGSREVFRYLAHFEHRLKRHGLRTLRDMPTQRLRRALAQFEAIVSNWSSPHLADLRSRMAVAVIERDSGAAMWAPAPTLSKAYAPLRMPMLRAKSGGRRPAGFQASRQVDVEDDVNISRFEAAMGEWDEAARQHAGPGSVAGPVTH